MVIVNIGGLPAALAAADLFGAAQGAYTGAPEQKGYFRRAHGSTLFLDEIGDTPTEIQVMLLRVLEEKTIFPLGKQRGEKVDVRVIAATDADLERRIESGAFRRPLLHRLAGFPIRVPPLRQRRDDIGRLMLHFLGLELSEVGATDRLDQTEPKPWLPMDLVLRLVRCRWFGNVRQFQAAMASLVIHAAGKTVATMSPQLEQFLADADHAPAGVDEKPPDKDISAPVQPPVRHRVVPSDYSDENIKDGLRAHRWNITYTCKALGIAKVTLYNRIEQSSIMRTAKQVPDDEIREVHARCKGDIEAMVDALEVSKNALKPRLKELGLPYSEQKELRR